MNQEIKLTNEEKLMIIEQLLDELSHGKPTLQVIQSYDALQGKIHTTPNVHTYQVLGSQQTRKTQTGNLIMKVQQSFRQQHIPQHQPNVDEKIEVQKGDSMFRYFKNNIRCFRCKKIGHHNYACLDQNGCTFCLSTLHFSQKCPQRTVCYQCYQWGHVISQCTAGSGAFCQQCKRKHNRVCCFLAKGIDPIKQMYNSDYLYNSQHIRCMNCFEYGHIYCNSIKNEI